MVGLVGGGEMLGAVRVAGQVGVRHGDGAAGASVHGQRGRPFQRPVRGRERGRDEHGRVVTGEDAAEQLVVHAEERRPGR